MTAEELSKDWTPEQKLRLTCALNLYQFAHLIMAEKDRETRRKENPEDEATPNPTSSAQVLCLMGGLAEKYRANLFWLQEMLAVGNQIHNSLGVAVARWEHYYARLVRKEVRPAIRQHDAAGEREVTFVAFHKTIMETLANVRTFRKSIKEEEQK